MVSGSFRQKAEHRRESLFVVGALLGETQSTRTSQAARAETLVGHYAHTDDIKQSGWVNLEIE